jgi:hypothetical protein
MLHVLTGYGRECVPVFSVAFSNSNKLGVDRTNWVRVNIQLFFKY